MEVGKISAQARDGVGTGAARKLRNQGQIPAICYGSGAAPLPVSVDPAALQKALDPLKGRNTLLTMRVEGAGGPQEIAVLLKDTQRDRLTGRLLHADFLRVQKDQPVRVTVPIALVGKAEGVKAGGALHQVYRTLPVLCAPDKIPTKIEIDVTTLNIGQSVHVSDLKLEAGVTSALPGTTTLCVVTVPKAEKAAAEGEAAPGAEGVAAATPAEGGAEAPTKAAPAKAAPAKAAPAKAAPAKAPTKGK